MTILVVDDDQLVLRVIAGQLRRLGHDVLTAENGHDAMDIIHRERPQVILTDFNMDPLGGWPWIEYLVELCAESVCRIVVMTGEERDKSLPVALLKKPFTPEQLADAVAR